MQALGDLNSLLALEKLGDFLKSLSPSERLP